MSIRRSSIFDGWQSGREQVISLKLIVLDAARFQLVWWLLILQGNEAVWLASLVLIAQLSVSRRRIYDGVFMLAIAMPGLLLDSLLNYGGALVFTELPLWLALLWCHFGLSCLYSLQPMWRWSWLSVALVGAIGGSGSYIAGLKLGAVSSNWSETTLLLVLAPLWALVFIYIKSIVYQESQHQPHHPPSDNQGSPQ